MLSSLPVSLLGAYVTLFSKQNNMLFPTQQVLLSYQVSVIVCMWTMLGSDFPCEISLWSGPHLQVSRNTNEIETLSTFDVVIVVFVLSYFQLPT